MIFEDRILKNPRLFRLKDPRTNEIVDFEIQDLLPEEIEQEGTEISAALLNQIMNNIEATTITETGSNSNGNWIKFGDGTMITTQFYATAIQSSQWAAWGSCYSADLTIPPNYPQTFVGYPCVTKSISNSGNNGWIYYKGADLTTRSGEVGVVRPAVAGATTYFTVNVIAIGRWK